MTSRPSITDVDVAFIVGPMRTGTTLLARLLDSHPQVAYLGFELAEQWAAWTRLPFGAPGAEDVACPALAAADVTPERIEAARAGLSELLRERVRRDGVRPDLVVLKNPHFWHRLPLLFAVLPRVRLVRTRRAVLSTVASLRRLWQRSLDQHGRLHHLPRNPTACWDFVASADHSRYDPGRTFPGGDVRVLAEFWQRVEVELDRAERTQPRWFATTVMHAQLVSDLDATSQRLLRALALTPAQLRPPEPLEPQRREEWRTLLTRHEQEAVESVTVPCVERGIRWGRGSRR